MNQEAQNLELRNILSVRPSYVKNQDVFSENLGDFYSFGEPIFSMERRRLPCKGWKLHTNLPLFSLITNYL